MNYLAITKADIANGIGFRTVLWVSGCHHHCKGCHNPESWDFNAGKEFTIGTLIRLGREVAQENCTGLTISGGDPFAIENQKTVMNIARFIKSLVPDKKIWCYTGCEFKHISKSPILQYVDVVVDGEFIESKRDITLAFRGSPNQNIWFKNEDGQWYIKDLDSIK